MTKSTAGRPEKPSSVGAFVARGLKGRTRWAWMFASLLSAAVLWEVVARFVVRSELLLPSLWRVFESALALFRSGELTTHLAVSGIEFLLGFLLSVVLGILVAVILTTTDWLQNFFEPWINLLNATPMIALGPLFIIAMGIGIESKVAIIFLSAVFAIIINTMIGVKMTDPHLLDVASSYGASKVQTYIKVRLPSALGYIFAGLRIGAARALVGVFVAEFFGARAGVGYLILQSAQAFDAPGLYVGVLILGVGGVMVVGIIKWVEKIATPWIEETRR